MTEKIVDKVISLCGEYLSGPWKEPANINIQTITQGFANRNFRCSLNCVSEDSENPSDVIVHIYGNDFSTGNDSSDKVNGEAAESLLVNILSRIGLAPKLYGVFKGGRIEEYIPGTTCTFDDFEHPVVNGLLAQKLARIHSQQMPISKVPNRVTNCKALINRMLAESGKTLDSSKFDVMQEFDWYEKIIQIISGQPVFNHGDVNPNNVLVIRDKKQVVKNVMFIDYEECCYFYRSADIANLFNLRCVQIQNKDGNLKMIFASEEFRKNNEDIERQFMQEYLKEWKSLNSEKVDQRDSLESLQMEVDFSRLFIHAFFVAFLTNLSEWCDPGCQEYLKIFNYEDIKQKTVAKYKDQIEFLGVE